MIKKIIINFILLLLLVGISPLFGQEVKTKFSGEVFSISSFYEDEISSPKTSGDILLDESFEGDVIGWTIYDNDNDGYSWQVYSDQAPPDTAAHTGLRGFGVVYNSAGNDDWLMTPQISLPAGATGIDFSFWAHSHSSSYPEDFNVKLSTTGHAIGDFTVTLEEVRGAPLAWTQYSYDLSAYAGKSIYLAVQCVSVDKWYLWADDFVVTATGGTTQDQWTILIYLDGDNNLEYAAINDINEMEQVSLPDNINVIVQLDRIGDYDDSNGDWTDTRRYEITHDTDQYIIGSTLVDGTLGELNMGDPQTLTDFLNWGIATYPAENYMLVLWDHGGGWRKKVSDMSGIQLSQKYDVKDMTTPFTDRGIIWDDTDDDYLEMREVKSALSAADNTVDILGFDACLMGLVEVAYEVKSIVDSFVVFSQDLEPGDGWDYTSFLTSLSSNPAAKPSELAGYIVDSYQAFYTSAGENTTQSAVKLSEIDNLKTAIDNFLTDFISDPEWSVISAAFESSYQFGSYNNYIDIGQFMTYCANNFTNGSTANSVVTAIDDAVIHNGTTGNLTDATGLNIYFHKYFDSEWDYYNATYCDFAGESNWKSFVIDYTINAAENNCVI